MNSRIEMAAVTSLVLSNVGLCVTFVPVVVRRTEPEQPGQQLGRQTLPGKPTRVREKSEGGGGGELGVHRRNHATV